MPSSPSLALWALLVCLNSCLTMRCPCSVSGSHSLLVKGQTLHSISQGSLVMPNPACLFCFLLTLSSKQNGLPQSIFPAFSGMGEIFPVPDGLTSLPLSWSVVPLIPLRSTSNPLPPQNPLWPPKWGTIFLSFKLYYDLFLCSFFGTFCSISLIVNFHILSLCLQINSGQILFHIQFSLCSI